MTFFALAVWNKGKTSDKNLKCKIRQSRSKLNWNQALDSYSTDNFCPQTRRYIKLLWQITMEGIKLKICESSGGRIKNENRNNPLQLSYMLTANDKVSLDKFWRNSERWSFYIGRLKLTRNSSDSDVNAKIDCQNGR